ncbi:MAG: GntR family transcriptional regulator [Paracoccaceae bacterium]|nr:GntR family transcriptional regulator [Paracoccaceae bacterium]
MNAGISDKKELLRERVLEQVRRDITLGDLEPDGRLTERDLCERHSISRTVAREVIRQLDAEGLGRFIPHQGLRVTRMSRDLVEDIYEIRLLIELRIIERFTEVATPDELAHLRYLFDRLSLLSDSEDYEELAARSFALLDYMVKVTGKQTAGEVLHSLSARIKILRVLSMRVPGQVPSGIAQLERLITAIGNRDKKAAAKELRAYMAQAVDSVLGQVERLDPKAKGAT